LSSTAPPQRAIVYVDGFNLYYGCLKRSPYRWLDLVRMSELLLPAHTIVEVKYFTAIVDSPTGSVRQQAYIRALEARGRVSTYRGHFLSHTKTRPRASTCATCGDRKADVIITEEKGTDVNLATHLVYDACNNAFDVAAIVSNDSDLVLPVVFAREKCGKTVGVLNPQKHPAVALHRSVDFYKKIRPGVLGASQLPPVVVYGQKEYLRPPNW